MNIRKAGLAVAAATLGVACASARKSTASGSAAATKSSPTNAQTYDTKNGKVVCRYETSVGTHIPERRCFYEEDVDVVRRETVDRIIQQRNTTLTHGGG